MKLLISGVAGFIGAHAAAAFLSRGDTVVGFDNLSRRGADDNLSWLEAKRQNFEFINADIRNANVIASLVHEHNDCDVILHLAGQVAVTTSITNPRLDFETNALGTFNLLESTRVYCPETIFLYSSTNKVYGEMPSASVVERGERYAYRNLPNGISENMPLDFHSPYGCSKGAADQYVRDYGRIYGIRTVVCRQSCIYGTRQFGLEDQGWIAWFTIATVMGRALTLYGDGKQVRDVLWIDDLIELYIKIIANIDQAVGEIFNVGGGPNNTLSLLELIDHLGVLTDSPVRPTRADWRPGDQKIFVSDISKARSQLGWDPIVSPEMGLKRLLEWTLSSKDLIKAILGYE